MTDCFVAVAAPRRALLRCRVLAAPAPGFMIVAIQPLVEAMHTAKTSVLLLLVGVATSAAAHHSAAQLDFSKTVLVEGTINFLDVACRDLRRFPRSRAGPGRRLPFPEEPPPRRSQHSPRRRLQAHRDRR